MNEHGALARHWPALVVGAALLVLGGFALFGDPTAKWHGPIVGTLAAVPVLIAVAQYLYQRVDRFYLGLNRAKLAALNPSVRLGLSAEFQGVDHTRALKEAVAEIEGRAGEQARAVGQINDGLIWTWNGVTMRLRNETDSDPVDGGLDVLRLEVFESVLGYRDAVKTIESRLGPLLCDLDQAIESDSRKFSVAIRFRGTNPYFGAFVKSTPRERISSFSMRILEEDTPSLPEDVIEIRENSLQIVAAKAHTLQRLGLRYLRLLP